MATVAAERTRPKRGNSREIDMTEHNIVMLLIETNGSAARAKTDFVQTAIDPLWANWGVT